MTAPRADDGACAASVFLLCSYSLLDIAACKVGLIRSVLKICPGIRRPCGRAIPGAENPPDRAVEESAPRPEPLKALKS
jgi:hypothetical protein